MPAILAQRVSRGGLLSVPRLCVFEHHQINSAMWRAAGMGYLRYSNEMAGILRQCLREPYREKAMQRDVTHMVEKVWANGVVQAKNPIDDIAKGFELSKGGVGGAD